MRTNALRALTVCACIGAPAFASVSVAPTSAAGGSVITSTVTFSPSAGAPLVNGSIKVLPPLSWGGGLQTVSPAQPGYVFAQYSSGGLATVVMSSTSAAATVQNVTLTSTASINVVFNGLVVSCPPAGQSGANWNVAVATSASAALALVGQPSTAYISGSANSLAFVPWNSFTVAANQPSAAFTVQPVDHCGNVVALTSSLTVTLAGLVQSAPPTNFYGTDNTAQFSLSAGFPSTISTLALLSGTTSAAFYYKTAAAGAQLSVQAMFASPTSGGAFGINRFGASLSAPAGFSGLSVDNGAVVAGQTHVTITPDGTGANNLATIRFVPSDPNAQWHVVISSNNFQTIVSERWGFGNPFGGVTWDGRNMADQTIVPSATYTVKVEFPGLAADTSLSITVNTAQLAGSVTLSGNPAGPAQIVAQGSNGPGYGQTVTDANGHFTLNGLHAGTQYNVYATYTSSATQAVYTAQLNNIQAPSTGLALPLAAPQVIRIAASASAAPTAVVFGQVNLHSADYSSNYFTNIRMLPGSTTSDNGDSFTPSTWSVLYVKPGTYTMHLTMPGYGAADHVVSTSSDVVLALTPQASIYGKITLPSPASFPLWVPVQGTLAGSSFPTVYGGASFNVGQSTAIYSIFAVPAGTYNLAATPQGLEQATISNVSVGTADLGNLTSGGVDFSTFLVGGTIGGQMTVNGDTSQSSPYTLYLNAYSQQTGLSASTQVSFATSTTQSQQPYAISGLPDGVYMVSPPFLQGFESNPLQPKAVAVSGGVGSLNFTLTRVSGQITGHVKLPTGASDYTNVHLSLQGNNGQEIDLPSGPAYTISHVGTGFYTLTATYRTSGAQTTFNFSLVNGQTQTIDLDLSAPTFTVSGTVSIVSGFNVQTSTGVATVATISDLLQAATAQALTIGGAPMFTPGTATQVCSGGVTQTVSTARVEAFPKTFNSFNNPNNAGVANCYGVGQYKYGVITSSGAYAVPQLTPGVWEIDVYPYFDGGTSPNAAATKQTVTITAGDVSGVNFSLSNGNAISGTLSLPTGVTDSRSFTALILTSQGDVVQRNTLQVGDLSNAANSVAFQFTGLPAGQYSLAVQDLGTFDNVLQRNVIKYVAKPVQFTIAGVDLTNVNVAMARSSSVTGQLAIQGTNATGQPTLTLITSANVGTLPNNFFISANANPWVPGGSQSASFDNSGHLALDANNKFTIDGLVAGTYDVRFQQNASGSNAAGTLNLAGYVRGSVIVSQGQATDLGTVVLMPGLSITGAVTDQSGNPLPNIPVDAGPSTGNNKDNGMRVYTDSQGHFVIPGLDPAIKIYDFVAARRPGTNDNTPPVPYGEVAQSAIDVTQVPAPVLTFTLPQANSTLTGKIVTADGGPLAFPDSDQAGYPAAAIFLHPSGTVDADNPLGDESATALDGTFQLNDLVAGTYDITVESLGYQPVKLSNVVLNSLSTTALGTITLQNGPSLTATVAKPDGSAVNTNDVNMAVAATSDLSSIIFGRIQSDAATTNILSVSFAGFQLSPSNYSILLFDNNDNIILPTEGRNLVFASTGDSITRALTYQPSAPTAFTHVLKVGSSVAVTFYLSRPLRNRGDDQDPTQWIFVTHGQGTLSGESVSGDRRQFTVLYTPASGEQNATLQFSAHTVDIDPSTGVEFVLAKSVTLLLGQKASVEANINSALGGNVSLAANSDPSHVAIPSNALLTSSGTKADPGSSYSFTFTATDTAGTLNASPSARAASFAHWVARGAASYVSEAYAGMLVARDQLNVNPLSSFYSVLLPAGLSHALNQTAYITLNYDASADPSQINVYYFDGAKYLLEANQRTVDPVNRTITVGVTHFSTFVVLQNASPVLFVSGGSSASADIQVMNFPNPFNLQSKTEALQNGGSLTTEGTIIRYVIPSAMLAPSSIDIFDVVGHKVRTIALGTPVGGTLEYVSWDGCNDSGRKVASGVYIGELKVGGQKRFFKMAVIK